MKPRQIAGMRLRAGFIAAFLLAVFAAPVTGAQESGVPKGSFPWHSPATLHKAIGKETGEIVIDDDGVQFRPDKGTTFSWPFLDIQTFKLSPHRLIIETYKNRTHHVPGMQRYRFELSQDVPSTVATELARGVGRPSQNAVLEPALPNVENIPAHHRTRTGGTNGILRFGDSGMEYVTSSSGDSRSWRWADLQTISNPAPYSLFVFGYRDTYTFDLKEPLSRALLNRLTDEIYSHGTEGRTGDGPEIKRTENW